MTRRLRTTRIADLNRGVYNSILMHYKVNCAPVSLEGATVTLTCKDVPFDDESDSTSAKFIIAGEIDAEDPSKVLFPITAEQSQLDPDTTYYADIVVVTDGIPLRKAILEFGVTAGVSNANADNTSTDGAVGSRLFINDIGRQLITVEVVTGERGVEGVSVSTAFINNNGHLIIGLSNGSQIDAGLVSDYSGKLNHELIESIAASADESTVQLEMGKRNLLTEAIDTESLPLPVANGAQAGIMNAATFQGLEEARNDIASLKNEAFAASGVPADYTQSDITNAWLAASGEAEVHNGAVLWDIDNQRRFGYYGTSVGEQWILTNAGGGSTPIANFTNATPGLIRGSASADGQVFAEADGTGSVNGWDTVSTNASNAVNALPNKLDKVTAASDNLQVYGKNTDGTQGMVSVASDGATAGTIVQRTASGAVFAGVPTVGSHVATKTYVDGAVPYASKVAHGCTLSATATVLTLAAGVALVDGVWVIVEEQTLPNTTTLVAAGGTGYITIDVSGIMKAYPGSIDKFPIHELPIGVVGKNSSNSWLPMSIVNFNMTTSDNIDFATIGDFSYSLDEVATKSTWVDGEIVYKKVINFGAWPNNTVKRVLHGIVNLGTIISVNVWGYRPSIQDYLPAPLSATSTFNAQTTLTIDKEYINIQTGQDRSNVTTCYAVIKYTKLS